MVKGGYLEKNDAASRRVPRTGAFQTSSAYLTLSSG